MTYTNFLHIVIATLIVILLITRYTDCGHVQKTVTTDTVTITQVQYLPSETIHDTTKRIQYIPKFFNGNEVLLHDTVYRDGKPLEISPLDYCKQNLSFTVSSDTTIFNSGDSLTAKFTYPLLSFDFDFHPKPKEVITKTITNTIEEPRFGFYIGGGIVATTKGQTSGGAFIGFGYRIF